MRAAQCPDQHIAIAYSADPQYIQLLSIRLLTEHAASIVLAGSNKIVLGPNVRADRSAFSRQVAMYLSHVMFGLTLTQTGALFWRDRTTVAYGCRVVEDCRDDPEFDLAVDVVGAAVVARLRWISRYGKGRE